MTKTSTDAQIVGSVSFINGDAQQFTDAKAYLDCIREELPHEATTGFRFRTITQDPAIRKAVDASPELRSKKALIETFIAGINDVSDVMLEWRTFVAEEKERQLVAIIQEENLKDDETRRFMESSFRDGSVKTTGTDIDRLMPPISRFGGGNRAEKKQTIIEKLKGFFDRFFGIG